MKKIYIDPEMNVVRFEYESIMDEIVPSGVPIPDLGVDMDEMDP